MAEQTNADFRGNLGRYALYGEIASGGMATVHLARLLGTAGFSRTVAIKRLHPHLSRDPDFVAMFLEEARLATRVRHPNVVATLDVVSDDGELFLVMEYVPGESLARLVRKAKEAGHHVPTRYVIGLICNALDGLHAAHEAKSERGVALGLVHRDVSPQNIHVGIDGVARVLDFGIAKATNRVQETRTDQIKGKIAYMSPEQLAKGNVDRRADIYSASVVLWEALTGERLFKADDVPSLVYSIINDKIRKPSTLVRDLPKRLDDILLRGLDREAPHRWATARDMAEALESVLAPAPPREIGEWVTLTAGDALAYRQELVHRMESATSMSMPPPLRIDSPGTPIEIASGIVPAEMPDARSEAPTITNEASAEDPPPVRLPAPSMVEESTQITLRARASLAGWILAGTLLIASLIAFAARSWQLAAEATAGPEPSATPSAAPNESAIVIGGALRVPHPSPSQSGSASPGGWPRNPTPREDCEDPFMLDAQGVRHPKPQCFRR